MNEDLFDVLNEMVDYDEEVRERYIRAPFAWPGGKSESLKHILPRLSYRNSWIDHCGGSGIVTLNRLPSKMEVFNDRNSGVTAFYRVIKDREKLKALADWLSLTVHSREEFIWCRDTWQNCQDDVERAARWYYTCRMSFSGQRRNFARTTKGRSQHPNAIYGILPLFQEFHQRFSSIQIENLDLFQSIKDFDQEDAVHYLDPNYYGASPGIYENEIDEEMHWRLCQEIMNGKGFFALSGYPNKIYDSKEFNWDQRFEWDVTVYAQPKAFTETNNKIGTGNYDRKRAKEVLWIRDNAS